MSSASTSVYQKIYRIVARIPKGRVATYGQIAKMAGIGNQPRRVGYALSIAGDAKLPWHRVINAKGEVSRRWEADAVDMQRSLLMDEGMAFDAKGRIDLKKFQWKVLS